MTIPAHHPIDILRFNTCGSVDDGKSTLIGRLLYDSKSLMEDQLEALERSADITGGGQINLANLTDGAALLEHAEDIGRHNAVDKVIGGALMRGRACEGLGLLVTGRISAELAFKAARAGMAWVATPSVPSTLAQAIAARAGVILVGRAVSGQPQVHRGPGVPPVGGDQGAS